LFFGPELKTASNTTSAATATPAAARHRRPDKTPLAGLSGSLAAGGGAAGLSGGRGAVGGRGVGVGGCADVGREACRRATC
jgi:hypothetical protein